MIGSLRGVVQEVHPPFVLLEVAGVGYLVSVSIPTIATVSVGSEARFYIYDNVREDARDAYGFSTYDELQFFKKLISISGVGPKVALTILSAGSLRAIQDAILSGNLSFLTSVPGVGMKTAQKIVLELKGKIVEESDSSSPDREVMDALVSLGYSASQARDAVSRAGASEEIDVSQRVRLALKYLAK
ncbi:MAG: Holliday junction branch migration protein RuvA [Patescibacteria group bacterium]